MKITPVILLSFFFSIFCSLSHANEIEHRFIESGLVDVSTVAPTIQVNLVNSDPKKNFLRENYYSGLNKAYLHKEIALKLADAQKILKRNQIL